MSVTSWPSSRTPASLAARLVLVGSEDPQPRTFVRRPRASLQLLVRSRPSVQPSVVSRDAASRPLDMRAPQPPALARLQSAMAPPHAFIALRAVPTLTTIHPTTATTGRRASSAPRRTACCSRATSTARPGRPRDARRALPAAGPPARAPLPAPRGAVRRPLPGRLPRAREGDRPLRPRARRRVLELRGADDPRRDQALLPRPDVVGARPARPAGARAAGRPGGASSRGDLHRRRRCEEIAARVGAAGGRARGPRGARRLPRHVAEDSARRDDEAGDTLGDTVGTDERGFGLRRGPGHAGPARCARHAARARGAAPALRGGPHAGRDRRAIGVSQMQVSRIIRQSLARLRTVARRRASTPRRRSSGSHGADARTVPGPASTPSFPAGQPPQLLRQPVAQQREAQLRPTGR